MPYVSEKSIIRPTFSYMGNFTISDSVFRQIIDCVVDKIKEVHKISRCIIKKNNEQDDGGVYIYIEVVINFGFNVNEAMGKLKHKIIKEIENLTAMNVKNIEIVVKGVNFEKEENENA